MNRGSHRERYSGIGVLYPVTWSSFPVGKRNMHSFTDFKLRLSIRDDVSQRSSITVPVGCGPSGIRLLAPFGESFEPDVSFSRKQYM